MHYDLNLLLAVFIFFKLSQHNQIFIAEFPKYWLLVIHPYKFFGCFLVVLSPLPRKINSFVNENQWIFSFGVKENLFPKIPFSCKFYFFLLRVGFSANIESMFNQFATWVENIILSYLTHRCLSYSPEPWFVWCNCSAAYINFRWFKNTVFKSQC